MPALGPDQWRALSPYLDKALEIPCEERALWLDSLREENPSVALQLQTLLSEYDALGAEGFLEASVRSRSHPAPLRGQTVGAYALESPIGQGGMGTVWLARRSDGRFEGRVAVKFLNIGLLGGPGEERFKREGRILAQLAHPNIARLADAGVSPNGQPYLILEYVEGKQIDNYCNEHALDVEARIRLFLNVLAAVAHAHANLIVHRDLKPSNVFVTDDGQVKLLDFGIAKLLEDEAAASAATVLTRQGERALTLACAAPEQVTGAAVTTGTDVYALGLLLYLLLTGKHPAQSALRSPAALIKAIVETEPARPSDITEASDKAKRALRGDLDTIVAKALKKNPQERYASVTALGDDLRRYLEHQPISARPDRLAYRARKFVRRNQLAVVLVTGALIAVIAGAFGTAIQARTARRERDHAIRELARAETINDFNSIVLTDAAPWGEPVTVNDLLARAEQLIDSRGDADNTKRAELLMSVASEYHDHEQYGIARRLLEQAVQLARTSSDPSTRARASCQLGDAIASTGSEILTAESLIQAGLKELAADARFALDRVSCLQAGAFAARMFGHRTDAITQAQSAQRALRQAPFQPALLELDNLALLATSYFDAGRTREALATFEQGSEIIRTQGLGSTQRAMVLFSRWARALAESGRPLEAERLINRAIEIDQRGQADRAMGPFLMASYALVMEALGRSDDAEKYLARLDEAQNERIVLLSLSDRATIYRQQGNLERATQMVSELERRLRGHFPVDDVRFATLAKHRALIAKARGEKAAAIDFANQGVTIAEAAVRDSRASPLYLHMLFVVRSEVELDLGHIEDAISDAQRALKMLMAETPPETLTTHVGHAYLALGRALHTQGKREEAQAAFLAAVKHLEGALGPDHTETQAARHLIEGGVQPR